MKKHSALAESVESAHSPESVHSSESTHSSESEAPAREASPSEASPSEASPPDVSPAEASAPATSPAGGRRHAGVGRAAKMRIVIAALLILLVVLQLRLWFGSDGLAEVRRLEAALAAQREENARLEARNLRLAAEVHDLKEGLAAVEERARTDLGMIGKDETYYQIVDR